MVLVLVDVVEERVVDGSVEEGQRRVLAAFKEFLESVQSSGPVRVSGVDLVIRFESPFYDLRRASVMSLVRMMQESPVTWAELKRHVEGVVE